MFLTPSDLATRELSAEIVVVGAGAAGIAISQALHAKGHDVLLVEGGGFDIEVGGQALFDSRSIGVPMNPLEGRYRTFGGATVAWTGRCAPFDRIDFEPRAWVSHSGWPIAYDALARHYGAAAALVGLDSWHAEPPWFEGLRQLPGRPDAVEPHLWRFFSTSRGTFRHFGEMVWPEFQASPTLRVLIQANLIALEPDCTHGAIGAAIVRARDGAEIRIAGQQWVLACGGIENARLLLNFAERTPAPFAAVSPMIGRYFMQHPRTRAATIEATPRQARLLQRRFNLFRRPGLHYEAGFALSDASQRRDRLLNASAVLRYEAAPTGHAARALRSPGAAIAAVRRELLGHEPVFRAPVISLHVDVEQRPDPDSRILLLAERDAIGLRKAAVDWRIDALDRRTAAALTNAVLAWIEAMNLGQGHPLADLEATGGLIPDRMMESLHHLGATRMGRTPADSVVDADLKVHGIANLYVCGGSVMPTGGHANPTLTILALALRLAGHLHLLKTIQPPVRGIANPKDAG